MNGAVEAGWWGLLGASGLVLGAVVAFSVDLPARLRGLIEAFGAGILFGVVAYELVAEAAEASVTGFDVAIGFGAGAVAFFLGSVAIDRLPATLPAPSDRLESRRDPRSAGLSIVLGTILDGLPESLVLGVSLVPGQGVAVPILVAVFLSNVPESMTATEDLARSGITRDRIVGLWIAVALASAAAAAIGFAVLRSAGPELVVASQAFAAGSLVAMLAESMIPEAYETGGRPVGLATALGFAVAAYLSFRS